METKIVLDFLSDLKENNNREWFAENKARYEEANAAMKNLIQDLKNLIPNFSNFFSPSFLITKLT